MGGELMPRPKENITAISIRLPADDLATINAFAIELGCVYRRNGKTLPGHRKLLEKLAAAMGGDRRSELIKLLNR